MLEAAAVELGAGIYYQLAEHRIILIRPEILEALGLPDDCSDDEWHEIVLMLHRSIPHGWNAKAAYDPIEILIVTEVKYA